MIIAFANFFVFTIMPCIANITFNRNIVLISPYVETHDIEKLKSDWLRMKTKSDYNEITNHINGIIQENHLVD